MANGKNIFEQIGVTPVQLAFGGGALFLVYKAAQKFGLVDSKEKENANKLLSVPYLSPSYLDTLKKGTRKYMTWTNENTVKDIARKIRDSKGVFNDNEAQLWGALRRVQYKSQAAVLSNMFNRMYSVDLTQYLSTFNSLDEMDKIYKYFDGLPDGLV